MVGFYIFLFVLHSENFGAWDGGSYGWKGEKIAEETIFFIVIV